MIVATRFLLLCAAVLAFPAIAATQPTPLAVQVWTRDAGGNDKTTFAPGENIQIAAQINNSYGGYLLAANGTQLAVTTSPTFYNNTKQVDIPPGISTWPWSATAPAGQASYIVTVKAYDHFYGGWTEGSASFTVGGLSTSADLSPTAIRYNSADLVAGKTVFFDSGVQNAGSQGTGVFNIRWFVDGVSVGYGSHAGVPANSTVLDGNSGYSWVAADGTHTIKFSVDVDNHVLESNESNNSQSVTVTVHTNTPYFLTVPQGKAPNLIVLVHGCCTDAGAVKNDWYYLAGLIMNQIVKHNPTPTEWEIVAWDWSTYTPPNNPGEAYRNAADQSLKLANSIEAAAIAHPYKYVHLIGHSAGSRLIDLTAKTLTKIQPPTSIPFLYLTFLDAYTPNGSDTDTYGSLNSPHYSEHYVDRSGYLFTDNILPNAYNFDITSWVSDNPQENTENFGHQWPRYWYAHSIVSTEPPFKYGHHLSFEGGNDRFKELGETYRPNGVCPLSNPTVTCEATDLPPPPPPPRS